MKRRLISGNLYNTVPKLVKLVSPLGIQQNYIIEKKYKFVDLLIVGGGGGGGTNSGSGGASGTIAFARNIKISLLPKTLTCKIAKPVNAQTDGDSTTLEINGDTIICAGGQRGNSEGAGGLGNGSKIPDSIYTILSKLVENPSSDIAICNNGGGSPGYWNGSYGYAGGSGASMSGNGNSSSGMTGGNSVSNADGMGGYKGGNSQSYQGGTGYKYNNVLIPIGLFGGGGTSGKGSNGSGSAPPRRLCPMRRSFAGRISRRAPMPARGVISARSWPTCWDVIHPNRATWSGSPRRPPNGPCRRSPKSP